MYGKNLGVVLEFFPLHSFIHTVSSTSKECLWSGPSFFLLSHHCWDLLSHHCWDLPTHHCWDLPNSLASGLPPEASTIYPPRRSESDPFNIESRSPQSICILPGAHHLTQKPQSSPQPTNSGHTGLCPPLGALFPDIRMAPPSLHLDFSSGGCFGRIGLSPQLK